MTEFWLFWLPMALVTGLMLGLTEYHRWQWVSRLMEAIERD